MSKCIYVLKICLVRHQLHLHYTIKRKVEKMSLFIIFVYIHYWFTSPSLTTAASNDLQLFHDLEKFSKVDKKVAGVGISKLQRHTWYLTEENIVFALFDESLPTTTRDELTASLSTLSPGDVAPKKPSLPKLSTNSKLQDFIGPRSILLFNLTDTPPSFLSSPSWRDSPDYSKLRSTLKQLRPINDSAERALGLATTVNRKMTLTEDSYQDLVQTVDQHRKMFAMKTKRDLKKFC